MSKLIMEGAIFQEAEIIKSEPNRARFRMVLQDADIPNQNKRVYERRVLSEAMESTKSRMSSKAFGGELDHPLLSGNEQHDGIRQTTLMLKELSHYILDYDWKKNQLIGELETATTPNGKILLALLRDKMGLGVSMRGMAELDRRAGLNYVKAPLYIISYDAVSLPSHKSAVVDFNEMRFESLNMLTECKSGVVCTPDGKCYLPDYLDKLIETKVIKFCDRWI